MQGRGTFPMEICEIAMFMRIAFVDGSFYLVRGFFLATMAVGSGEPCLHVLSHLVATVFFYPNGKWTVLTRNIPVQSAGTYVAVHCGSSSGYDDGRGDVHGGANSSYPQSESKV